MPRLYPLTIAILLCALLVATAARPGSSADTALPVVAPAAETDPLPSSGDAADDAAIWVHPEDTALSTVIGTDKIGGLAVYDLSGRQIQYLSGGAKNNVDLRYDLPLPDRAADIVVASDKRQQSFEIYRVDPATRRLEPISARTINTGIKPYGLCMYHSLVSGKYYVFVTKYPFPLDDPSANDGEVQQWELRITPEGKVDAAKVRTFFVGSGAEGCVADDVFGTLYIAETGKAIWKYGAEPDDGPARTIVDTTNEGGILRGEIEGLALYYASRTTGYLIAANQNTEQFVIYRREGANDYVMAFTIGPGRAVDGVGDPDGIEVANTSFGSVFPRGLFVAQDGVNTIRNTSTITNTNYKLVPWESIALAGDPPLTVDTSWNPRAPGAPSPTATAISTPGPSPTPTRTPIAPTRTLATPTRTPAATPPPAPQPAVYVPMVRR